MNVSLLLAAALSLACFGWFIRLERSDRRIVPVLFILGLLIVDVTLYENQDADPQGLFHPQIGLQSFRLPDVIVPLALAARLIAGTRSRRISVNGFWWFAFLLWLAAATVVGISSGNSSTLAVFEAKVIIYLGVMALAAGVPARAYTGGSAFPRLLQATAVLAAFVTILDQASIRLNIDVPGLVVASVGAAGGDPSTIFAALGVIALVLGMCRETGRVGLLLAAGALLVPPFVSGQRAAVVGCLVSLIVLALLLPLARSRLRTTAVEVFLGALLIAGILIFPAWLSTALGPRVVPRIVNPTSGLAASYYATFQRAGKRGSAEARINQWRVARRLIEDRPIFGWGLGKTYIHYDPGISQFVVSDLTHNIGIDLLLRTGIVGILLFLVALGLSLWGGIRAWLYDVHRSTAALALGAAAAVVGLVAKGMVESIFEKFRIATLLGILLGMLLSTANRWEKRA